MVIGAGCFVFLWQQAVVCWVYLVGALMFTSMQAVQIYEGKDLTVRRLKRIQSLANLFFVLSGLLMIDAVHHVLLPLFRNAEGTGLYNYQLYLQNKWVILLLVAAMLEVYTTHRLDHELKSEK